MAAVPTIAPEEYARRVSCGCGIPSRANYYVQTIVGRDVPGGTETEGVDAYVCDEHMPADWTVQAAREFHDLDDSWEVLETYETELR